MSEPLELESLSAEEQSRVEDCCSEFEAQWSIGQQPSIFASAVAFHGPLRSLLLRELLEIEQYYRSQSLDQQLSKEELVTFHPDIAAELTSLLNDPSFARESFEGDTRSQLGDHTAAITNNGSGNHFAQLPTKFGRYQIVKRLGIGGMGSVYLAEDTQLARQVAIKLPQIDTRSDPQWVTRFYREAKAAANLNHPHVCAVYDIDKLEGVHFLSMEYVPGDSLANLFKAGKSFTNREAAQLILKIASALVVCHEQGIIHRDLKPANLMIKPDGSTVITDFGLVQISRTDSDESQITQHGQILGSPSYMSPEQVQANPEDIGPATDIYSLGVILYELLTGQRPFQGAPSAVFAQILSTQPPPITQLNAQADQTLSKICQKMMNRSRDARYGSMHDVVLALEAWLKQEASPTLTIPSLGRTRTGVIAAGFFFIALISLAAVLLIRTPQGDISISVNDEAIRVLIDNERLELTDLKWTGRRTTGPHQLSVMIGDQLLPIGEKTEVTLDGERHEVRLEVTGMHLAGNQFQIVRGDDPQSVVVDIQWFDAPQEMAGQTPPASFSVDEQFARWVVQNGGTVGCKPYEGSFQGRITEVADLPDSSYFLVEFGLPGSSGRTINAAKLENLEQMPLLKSAYINLPVMPKESWKQLRFPSTINLLNVTWSNAMSTDFQSIKGLERVAVFEIVHRQIDDDWKFLQSMPAVREMRIEASSGRILTELFNSECFRSSKVRVLVLPSRFVPEESEAKKLQSVHPYLTIVSISGSKPQYVGDPIYHKAANQLLDHGVVINAALRKGVVDFDQDNRPPMDEAFNVNMVRFPNGFVVTPEVIQALDCLPAFQVLQARGVNNADLFAKAEVLRNCSGLHFRQSDLTDEGFQELCQKLPTSFMEVKRTHVTHAAIKAERQRNPLRVMETD
ncbi:serine/threonine protein kinase [Bremerella sp.]|uniref:serine/threonine protein kinase n=1 Tax=Bremerella sp. TaxID=2795602 RepID=UPI00391BD00E